MINRIVIAAAMTVGALRPVDLTAAPFTRSRLGIVRRYVNVGATPIATLRKALSMDTPVSGTPRLLLRCEGLAVLLAAVVGYQALGASWVVFALLFLVPDAALAAYVAGPRSGALVYNAFHSYLGPAILAALAYLRVVPGAWPLCLIWVAHIGMDRSLGLGLKFETAFRNTHLGTVGRAVPTT